MAPGSIHPDTGERYEIVVYLPIAARPQDSYLETKAKETSKKLQQNANTLKNGEKIKKGQRQFWLVSQRGKLRNTGLKGGVLFAALRALCDQYCESPEDGTDENLHKICESGERRYGVHPPTPAESATELERVDAWLNDKEAEVPLLQDAVASLALCDSLEIDRRLKTLAKRLQVRVKPLSKSISDKRKKLLGERRLKNTGREVAINSDPGKLAEMVRQAEEILNHIGLKYFERNAELVHTVYCRDADVKDSKKSITKDDSGRDVVDFKGYRRDAESMMIQIASYQTLVMDLDGRASFWTSGKEGPVRCHVPRVFRDTCIIV